jgi:hypothetical protein
MDIRPSAPSRLANDLAIELVRGFAAVDALLQEQYEREMWETPDRVAERLRETIARRLDLMTQVYDEDDLETTSDLLGEAIDNLGRGVTLDPWDALAFNAPVSFRSHRIVLSEEPKLSDAVEDCRARLLERKIVILDERDGRLLATGASAERVVETVQRLLPDHEVEVVGPMPREHRPARCDGWRDKGENTLRVWVAHYDDEHIDEVLAAEDDDRIVVMAFVCSPAARGESSKLVHEPARVHLTRPVGNRPVIDGLTGRVLAPDG